MPPSTIPQAQVQAMIAELRTSGAFDDEPLVSPSLPRRGLRPLAIALTVLVAGAALGGGVGVMGVGMGLFAPRPQQVVAPTALALTQPVKVADEPSPAPASSAPNPAPAPAAAVGPASSVSAPVPIAATPAAAHPPRRLKKSAPRHQAPPSCLAGGPCSAVDVELAEQRLDSAYRSAQRAGVSKTRLAAAHRRWDELRTGANDKPRTTVAGYRKLAAQLSRRPAVHKAAKAASPRRARSDRDPPMIPFRRSR